MAGQPRERRQQQEIHVQSHFPYHLSLPSPRPQGSLDWFPNAHFATILLWSTISLHPSTHTMLTLSPTVWFAMGYASRTWGMGSVSAQNHVVIATCCKQWLSISSQVIHWFTGSLSGLPGMISLNCLTWVSSSSLYPSYFSLKAISRMVSLEKNVGSLCLWSRVKVTFWAHSICQVLHWTYYVVCLICCLQQPYKYYYDAKFIRNFS